MQKPHVIWKLTCGGEGNLEEMQLWMFGLVTLLPCACGHHSTHWYQRTIQGSETHSALAIKASHIFLQPAWGAAGTSNYKCVTFFNQMQLPESSASNLRLSFGIYLVCWTPFDAASPCLSNTLVWRRSYFPHSLEISVPLHWLWKEQTAATV